MRQGWNGRCWVNCMQIMSVHLCVYMQIIRDAGAGVGGGTELICVRNLSLLGLG